MRPALTHETNIYERSDELEPDRDPVAPRTVCGSHDDEEDGRPNIPLLGILLAVPSLVVVAGICAIWQPGLLASLLALVATPVFVFVATLTVAVIVRRQHRGTD